MCRRNRCRAGSLAPRSWRKAACSEVSSWAISASRSPRIENTAISFDRGVVDRRLPVVQHGDDGFGREEGEAVEQPLGFGREILPTEEPALPEPLQDALQHLVLAALALRFLLEPHEPLLGRLVIGEHERVEHRAQVAKRVHGAERMGRGFVHERAQHHGDGIGLPHVAEARR